MTTDAAGYCGSCNCACPCACGCPSCGCVPEIIQGSASRPDIGVDDVQPAKRQLVDDVVRDLVSNYPGTIQSANLPTPDTALVRLHCGDSTWLVSIARLEVSDGT